ncbi:MAG: winged helix-turn-helix domain-containing protein [Thermoanaerobaculia bacterium]|jgi:DNA-binding winged helix-turn-helix (wHTH) protein/TolB-like protein
MTEAAPGPGIARFGVFEFDPDTGELRKQGSKVRLQEQPSRILEILLRNSGRVVTRDELRESLWPADTFVDFDHSLNTAIRKLRTALDDSADTPRYVETLAKRGYRFVVPVEWIAPDGAAALAVGSAPASDRAPAATPGMSVRMRWLRIALIAAAGVAVAGIVGSKVLKPSPAATMHRAIAVLPIEDPDQATAYVSEGIAEAIIDGLSASPSIRVTARTSSFRYGKAPLDLRVAGRELGVTAVVTGRLEHRGDEYRLRLELVDTNDGAQLWAKEYRQQASDLDTLRARAVRDLAFRLGVTNADRPRAVKNAEAYDLYLRGRYHWNLRAREDLLRAVEYFQRAVELDPEFASGWAGLANAYGTLVGNSMVPGREEETQLKSIDAAKRAIELDANNAEAYASLAASKLSYYRDYRGAENDFKRAIALNPSISTAHLWYAHLLQKTGRADEALRESDAGWQLDPYSLPANTGRCTGRLMARRYDDALELAQEAQARDPAMKLTYCSAWANILKGDVAAAAAAASERYPEKATAFESAAAPGSVNGVLRVYLENVPESAEYERAAVHAMLGERDLAFAQLERSFAMHRAYAGFLWVDPRFDSLHDDPQFLDIALRLGLPQAKAAADGGKRVVSPSPARGGRSGD